MVTTSSSINWDELAQAFGTIETIREPNQLEKLSKDYYHFSPVLQGQLADKVANLVVRPANEADVLRAAKVCVDARVPVTVRGRALAIMDSAFPSMGEWCST